MSSTPDTPDTPDTAPRAWLDASPEAIRAWLADHRQAAYRARQVDQWLFQRRATSFDGMTDLPRDLRAALAADWAPFSTSVALHHVSPDATDKLLLRCADGRTIECVLMAGAERRTVCISTQVGCGMGCVFCASGLKGVERNLTKGEITEQILRARNLLPPDQTLTNIVVMGMGESLANLGHLIPALDRICSPAGLGLSPRRVTISTVGLPDRMRELAELDRPYHLAVSLHAPNGPLRDELVPVNAKVGLDAVLQAADYYFARTGRQVTYEYVLLGRLNDQPDHARQLGRLLAGRKAHVNLIPYNPVAGLPYERPAPADIKRFVDLVQAAGVSVTVRNTRGREIDAACGQLRRRFDDGREANPVGLAARRAAAAAPS